MPGRLRIVLLSHEKGEAEATALSTWADVVAASSAEEALALLRQGADGLTDGEQTLPSGAEILQLMTDGVAILDALLRIRWFSQSFADLAGDRPRNTLPDALGFPAHLLPTSAPAEGGILTAVRGRFYSGGRHLDVHLLPFRRRGDDAAFWLCVARDVSIEVGEREKLIAIHRAGRELSRLTQAELARMSMAERIDLLKANIIQYSRQILHFRNLEIRLCDPATKRLSILLNEGIPDGAERALVASEVGNGVTGYVAATGVGYICPNVARDPHYLPGALNARSSLTVPILDHNQVVGTFNVESDEASHFTTSDQEFLEVFAREIAVALNTLELLQAEKQFGREATVDAIVNEVSLPADEIVADAIRVLDAIRDSTEGGPDAAFVQEAQRRILHNARSVKASIQRVGRLEAPASKNAPATGLAGKRVLVADNDPTIRRSAHRLLGQLGCEVDTAGDAKEAIGLARSLPYDAILTDIRLPDMSGFELFSLLQTQSPTAAIVLMTGFGYDAAHSIVRARQAGLRVVLYKPFRMDRLIEAMEDALKLRGDANVPRPTLYRQAIL